MSSGRFDAEITSEDGKIDINCGSGLSNSDAHKKQVTVFRLLNALMYSRRFDRLFSEADTDGQFTTRIDVARALIDWADIDEQGFVIDGASATGEDYRYDAQRDRYRAHDDSYDTIDEMKMVRGVSDAFIEAFEPSLTVYRLQRRTARSTWARSATRTAATARRCSWASFAPPRSPTRASRRPTPRSSTTPGSTRWRACSAIARRRPASTAWIRSSRCCRTRRPRSCPTTRATRRFSR